MDSRGKPICSWVKSIAAKFKREGRRKDTNPPAPHLQAETLTVESGPGSVQDNDTDSQAKGFLSRPETFTERLEQGNGHDNGMDLAESHSREEGPAKEPVLGSGCPCDNGTNLQVEQSHSQTEASTEQLERGSEHHEDMDARVDELHSQADSFATEFVQRGERSAIDQAVLLDRVALGLSPPGHPMRSACLGWLVKHLWERYSQLGGMVDVEETITLEREILSLRPPGHPERTTSLKNLSIHLSTRHNRLEAIDDLKEAVKLGRELLEFLPLDHPDRSSFFSTLASQLGDLHAKLAAIDDPKESAGIHRDILALLPPEYSDRSTHLNNLAAALCGLYDKFGNTEDLNEAIDLNRELVALCPTGHQHRAVYLNSLATCLVRRHQKLGTTNDLKGAISVRREAMMLRQPGHQQRLIYLKDLADNLSTLYDTLGTVDDLKESIGIRREILALLPPGHPERPSSLAGLAVGLSNMYLKLGAVEDLKESISLRREQLRLLPQDHAGRPVSLSSLATDHCRLYNNLGNKHDLNEAIKLGREAVAFRSTGDEDRSMYLNELGNHLVRRFRELGALDDLEEGVRACREALVLRPIGLPEHLAYLKDLERHLLVLYDKLNRVGDLQESIGLCREVLALLSPGHPDRLGYLHMLATRLCKLNGRVPAMDILNEEIDLGRQVVALCPAAHEGRMLFSSTLANHLFHRYEKLGAADDLKEATSVCRETLAPLPSDHPQRFGWLQRLAHYLHTLYDKLGSVDDLKDSIGVRRQVLALLPLEHPDRPAFLNMLAFGLCKLNSRLGDMDILNEEISLGRQAVALCSTAHEGRLSYLTNLAHHLHHRYEALGAVDDLKEAIGVYREILALLQLGHPERLTCLNTLADYLDTLYNKLGTVDNLKESIYLRREVLAVLPPDDPRRSTSLHDLAVHLSNLYDKIGAVDALNEGITLHREVLALLPLGHPRRSSSLESLGRYLRTRLLHSPQLDDMKEIFTLNPPFLSDDPSNSATEPFNMLSFGSLLAARARNWNSAYLDARKASSLYLFEALRSAYVDVKSVDARPSTLGYIALALAQAGMAEPEEALLTFDRALGACNSNEHNLLSLFKVVIIFIAAKYDEAIDRMQNLMAVSRDDETTYCYIQVLGKMYLMRGDYGRALELLERGQGLASSCSGIDLETVSFIFGWSFNGLQTTARQRHCEALLAMGCAQEATPTLLEILKAFDSSEVVPDWVTGLRKKCVDMLETLGDEALSSGGHTEAVAQYSSALSLSPLSPTDILLKRSRARVTKGLWEDALTDADEVIKLDPSSHQAYEIKYTVLHGAERYSEAVDAANVMISLIECCPDKRSLKLRTNYTPSRETVSDIDSAVSMVFNLCPLVLIDLATGKLCGAEERARIFKSEAPFNKLVSEAVTMKADPVHISQIVAKYFQWVMFSHTWEGKEPTFKDVNSVESVWKLDESPLNQKLKKFCTTALKNGHRWAWSDTCCIDKDTSATLSQSLTSMYSWYAEAAETLVYLAGVSPESEPGGLTKSRWITRAWTLQELLASKVVRFYDSTWKPYLNDISTNHKESPVIKRELAHTMGVAPDTITCFQPEDLGVRERLRLASGRYATVEEDISYSLIGIFSSDIIPRYGLGKTALGQLLESIVARSGDVTVVAWTGESLPYNSALPSSLRVYAQMPYSPPPMETGELNTLVEQLKARLLRHDVLTFYSEVMQLPRATFSNRCLHLPCIVFPVTKVGVQESDAGLARKNLYRASASSLGKVKFTTMDVMPLALPQKLVFVHPWIHDLRDHFDRFMSYDEPEAKSSSDSGDEPGAGSDSDSDDSNTKPTPPLLAEPLVRPDRYTRALRLIARLGHPFDALLLEQQSNGQYKRVAAEHEIIVSGVSKIDLNSIGVKVLEIV